MLDIWNHCEPIAEEQYKKNNYKVMDYLASTNINDTKRRYCVIYCSSNDIWYPNELSAFKRSFIDNDYYEWLGISCDIALKEIYVRDIYKSWYVTGINSRINSIDKLIEFLKEEIGELPLLCVGSSSGGYLAALLACVLHANQAVCFSAQFSLEDKHAIGENPYLQKYRLEYLRCRYYNLNPYLENAKVPIYYICPIGVAGDREQCARVENLSCVKVLRFRSRHHGVVLYKTALSKLISMDEKELTDWYDKHCNKCNSAFWTSAELAGFQHTIKDFYRRGYRYLRKKSQSIREFLFVV